jgi:hypothetical protein
MLAERIVQWNLPFKINTDTMLRLIPQLFTRLVMIIWSTSETDIDPEWDKAKKQIETEAITEAKTFSTTPAVVKEAADEKNSAAG